MITCEICGSKTHAIRRHLREEHQEWSIERYQKQFPDAPIYSEEAMKAIEEAKAKQQEKQETVQIGMSGSNLAEKVVPMKRAESGINPVASIRTLKKPMHEIFKLGENPLAFSKATGKPIPITVLDPATVPEPDRIPVFDEGYIPSVELLKSIIVGIELNIPTYLYGHAGLGKSTMWELVASATNRPMRRVQHTINTEESHIVGQYVVEHIEDPKTGELKPKTKFQLGDLPMAMINGEIYLADEYDRAYPSVLSVYQAVLEGKPLHIKDAPPEMRLIRPHPEFRFVATGNTNGAGDDTGLYSSTVVQDAATFERFGIVERVTYMSQEEEMAILQSKVGCSKRHAKELIRFASEIRENAFPTEVSLTIGPRVLINIGKIGVRRGSMKKGIEVAYANRLPETERAAALSIAGRLISD